MKQVLFEKISARQTGYSLAILGANHGYRFEGDTVAINAMFTVLDQAAHGRNWALQLWACAQAPQSTNDLSGHLVAQAALPPIGEIADEMESFEVRATANYLAGQADYSMVLVLVGGNNGRYDEVHSFSVYPRRQQFQLPQIRGNASYRIENDRVSLSVGSICNPRCESNVSGTLAVELWALNEPYVGGAFEGFALAGATFGQVAGQTESALREFDLTFTAPPAGVWHYVLMLREWTAAGFVTRDFVNFSQTVTIAEKVVETEAKTAKVAAPATVSAVTAVVSKAPVAKAEPIGVKAGKTVAKKKTTASESHRVSINSASAEELAGVKGMPTKAIPGIMKARPFSTLEELAKVKGLGAKMLAKMRDYLRL